MAFDSRPSMAAALRALRVQIRSRRICGNDVFGSMLFGTRETYARHMDYVHFNPVKHGYVSVVAHWPHSTFHRWVKAGTYPRDWGGEGALDVAAGERSL